MAEEEPSLFIDRLKNTKLSISVTLLITIIASVYLTGMEGSRMYVQWHEHKISEVAGRLLAQQSAEVGKQIAATQNTAMDNARKLDMVAQQLEGLQISAAINTVLAFQTELDRHERTPENNVNWRAERDRLKRQVERAVDYRDCLMESQHNCDQLRGW